MTKYDLLHNGLYDKITNTVGYNFESSIYIYIYIYIYILIVELKVGAPIGDYLVPAVNEEQRTRKTVGVLGLASQDLKVYSKVYQCPKNGAGCLRVAMGGNFVKVFFAFYCKYLPWFAG